MSEYKKVLDKELRREKWQSIGALIFIITIVAILLAVSVPVSSTTIYGKTLLLTARQTDKGSKPRVYIKLDSGMLVLAVFPKHLAYQKDKKAEVIKGATLIGRPSYRVIRYVPSTPNPSFKRDS